MQHTQTLHIRPYLPDNEHKVIALWQRCNLLSPSNNPRQDIARKLRVNPELFWVGLLNEKLVATCMAGYEGHRGWINYLAVDPDYQRQGLASQIMSHAEDALKALGCPKINLQVRSANTKVIAFYESLGFSTDLTTSMGKRLLKDPPYHFEESSHVLSNQSSP
ncbi:MAG: GNAT family acetyltransferase [bacterium]|nr:GNAT family acetyltransferase [bacterium]